MDGQTVLIVILAESAPHYSSSNCRKSSVSADLFGFIDS